MVDSNGELRAAEGATATESEEKTESVGPPVFGRHLATLADVETTYVADPRWDESKSRRSIWQDFEDANRLLTGAAKVYAIWIGGSFLTDKLSPRDIDVVYMIDAGDRARRSNEDLQVIESFIRRMPDPLISGQAIPLHGLKVDSYVQSWAPFIDRDPRDNDGYAHYAMWRGYWDDFLGRTRSGKSKKSPTVLADARPRRGYLEVVLNEYA